MIEKWKKSIEQKIEEFEDKLGYNIGTILREIN